MAGNTTTGYLGGLKKPRRGKSSDSKSKVPGKLKTKAGIGLPASESGGGGGGGGGGGWLQATEKENTRVYREEYKTITSSDGLFTLQYKELYTIDYVTENGDTVMFKYLPLVEE